MENIFEFGSSSSGKQRRFERMAKLKRKRAHSLVHQPRVVIRRGLRVCSPKKCRRRALPSSSSLADDNSHDMVVVPGPVLPPREFDVSVLFGLCEDQELLDVGDMDSVCSKCQALVWLDEISISQRNCLNPKVSICCMKGNVTIPFMKEPPVLLRNLFAGVDLRSQHFLSNLRCYNNMFAFTSLGGVIDDSLNTGRGPPQFVISGQNYHRIGSLVPVDGLRPKFAQLYIYDTDNEVSNRLLPFSGHSSANGLDPSLVADLLKVMDSHNVLVKSFRMVRDFCRVNYNVPVTLRLFRNRSFDARVYNTPGVNEVAALVVGDFDASHLGRDIVVRHRGGFFERLHETHAKYIPLQYPLLFPFGEDQYQENIKLNHLTNSKSQNKRVRVSLREFIAFRLMERTFENSVIFQGRRLFQQFVVDLYSMIETQRLSYIRHNQTHIRAGFLSGVEEAVGRGDLDASSIGSRIVLPSSFTGGRRYMFNNCQDAMAICKRHGYPDLFLTVTCNPKWDEIQRCLSNSGNYAPYRPDVSCRVFQVKLARMMKDFRKGCFFGRVVASLYSIEFQKRGLPHAHILLWLDSRNKLNSSKAIDSVICAELPDERLFPKLFARVTNFMVHGPCGLAKPSCPCMVNNKCSKFYPKKFVPRTTFDDRGYPIYRRRNLGVSVLKNDVRLDNRNVVPYNPKLIMKYNAHVNIEYCNRSNCIKYLFKYITKGVDRVTAALEVGGDELIDEIKQYYDCRYLSPSESIWRTFGFDIHNRRPSVQRLTFHLFGEQRIVYKESAELDSVLSRNATKNTMFLAWMEANRCYASGRLLTYREFPTKFTYDADDHSWHPRKKGRSVGRLTFITPSTRELYYMRLLLNRQVGCTSFEDIRTVSGCVYDTYREACAALHLLSDDRQFIDAIDELSILSSGSYLRRVFAMMLLGGSMGDPLAVWNKKWEVLSDGLLYSRRKFLNKPDLVISDEDIKQMCLVEIDRCLRPNGKSLKDFKCMPKIVAPDVIPFNNILIANELSYDCSDMLAKHNDLFGCLNSEQLAAYNDIANLVSKNLGGVFFVDGFGGSGKTYLWSALSFRFRSEGKIVLNVASSGIAALLLPGGRTAHSQFSIPLVLTEESYCSIEKESDKAELLIMASLIIWDEAPMINRLAFEALERTLRDLMRGVVPDASNLPFGGKTVVFGGDFRQILPVIPRGSRADVVHATISSSPIWRGCKVFKLVQNMRLQFSDDESENVAIRKFAKWILDVGDGRLGRSDDGEALIEIPLELCLESSGDPIGDIVSSTYPDLLENILNVGFFRGRAILAPTLEVVERVNSYVIALIPSEEKEYFSCDTVCKCDDDLGIDRRWITPEFLNDIKCSGIPDHRLLLKVGVPIMLMRNIDISLGLCNGTRLIVVELGINVIGARIINCSFDEDVVYIPRMDLIPSDASVSITFQRRQFPIIVCFAMTINKSQGQTLTSVGLYLPRPVFSHGQLYVAVSRVKTSSGLKILALDDDGQVSNSTINVVYPEVFQNI